MIYIQYIIVIEAVNVWAFLYPNRKEYNGYIILPNNRLRGLAIFQSISVYSHCF